MSKIKNIVVTGGAGFIGSSFIKHMLSKASFSGNLVNYDLLTYAANLKYLEQEEKDSRYHFIQGNINDQSTVSSICQDYQIDTIINFAAETHVDNSIIGPNHFMDTNIMGVFNLLEVVRKFPHIHLHQVSTDEVFGSLGEEGEFNEESLYRPNSPYAASKAAADHLIRSYANTYGLSLGLSYCSNNFGPGQHGEKFIPVVISCCVEQRPIPIYAKGQNIREWLYVEDHVEALWTILNSNKRKEIFAIGGGEQKRNIDIVKTVIELLSQKLSVKKEQFESLMTFVTDRPGHDYRYALNASKIEKELGWACRVPFADGLDQTVDWYLEVLLKDQKNIINPVI